MSGIYLLNIGNTHTQWGWCNKAGQEVVSRGSLDTSAWMNDLSILPAFEFDAVIWAACVVPQAKKQLLESGFYKNLHFVDAEKAAAAGLDFSAVDTSTLGADRIANAAALLEYPLPAACFDCGTAITVEVVTAEKKFAGGAIMPGRKLMRQSLFKGTAALPELPLEEDIPGKPGVNTLQAMALGIDRGAVGMVREMIAVVEQYGVKSFIAAGGDGGFFCRGISSLRDGGSNFTLRGIAFIAAKHANLE